MVQLFLKTVDPAKILACVDEIKRYEGSREESYPPQQEEYVPQSSCTPDNPLEESKQVFTPEPPLRVVEQPKAQEKPSELPQTLEDYKRLIQRFVAKRAAKTGKLGLSLAFIRDIEPKLTTVDIARKYWEENCRGDV